MSDVTFRSDFDVTLVDYMGDDVRVCQAARVSTLGAESYDTGESEGLINFLMKNLHMSPFEHCSMTWLISQPIFSWREHMRHRTFKFNEWSGRYSKLEPVFYVPPSDRPFVQKGKPGEYHFVVGDSEVHKQIKTTLELACKRAYEDYEYMLSLGVAREVARMVLPVTTYSSAYVTADVRNLMHFLSLRTKSEKAIKPSSPQYEIMKVANMMESDFATKFPLVHKAFEKNGRLV